MLNYNNSTEFLKIFNRFNLEQIKKLSIIIDNKRFLECKVISISPRYIYFSCKDLKINQTGKYEYTLLVDETTEIDRGMINLDFSVKLTQNTNNIINYGTKQ